MERITNKSDNSYPKKPICSLSNCNKSFEIKSNLSSRFRNQFCNQVFVMSILFCVKNHQSKFLQIGNIYPPPYNAEMVQKVERR